MSTQKTIPVPAAVELSDDEFETELLRGQAEYLIAYMSKISTSSRFAHLQPRIAALNKQQLLSLIERVEHVIRSTGGTR